MIKGKNPISFKVGSHVKWPWMSPSKSYEYIGVMANSFRKENDLGNWVVIRDTGSSKLYEVLDCDLHALEDVR